jgi:hypothetical protein
VANFIETEQLLLVKKSQVSEASLDGYEAKLSFAQIRGSVPVYWAEVNTLRYKPDLQIMDLPDTVRPFCFSCCFVAHIWSVGFHAKASRDTDVPLRKGSAGELG